MFCPNCGTQNADTVTTCSKCGFNLKGAAAPKFKGTMLMVNAPANVPRAAAPAVEPQKAAPAVPSKLKGTMLGVAPPQPGAAPMPAPAPGGGAPPTAAFGMPQPAPAVQPAMAPQPAPAVAPTPPPPAFGAQAPGPGPSAPPPFGAPAAPPMGPPPAMTPMGSPGMPPPGIGPGGPHGGADPLGGTIAASPGFPGAPGPGLPGAPSAGFGPPPGFGGPPANVPAPPQAFGPPPGAPPFGAPPQGAPGGGPPGLQGFGAALDRAASDVSAGFGGAMRPAGAGPLVPASPGVHGPIGNERNWLVILVVSCVCFVAGIYYWWTMLNELKAFRQKDDLNPILLFVPVLQLLLLFQLPDKVLDAKRMAGVPNPEVQSGIMYLLLGWYFFPNDLNEIWSAAAKRGQVQAYGGN